MTKTGGTRVAIMQPYFMPYIGYFQLLAAVDTFVIYDNIKYTKKGWINRNRFLKNQQDELFTLPLKKDSDYLDVKDRTLSADFKPSEFLNQMAQSYRKAARFNEVYPLLEKIIHFPDSNLFNFIHHSVILINDYLGLKTNIIKSSDIKIDHQLKSQDKVLAICNALSASVYINAIGGQDLYERSVFDKHGVELKFIQSNNFEYQQFDHNFIPWLSIIDCMMFNSKDLLSTWVHTQYKLI